VVQRGGRRDGVLLGGCLHETMPRLFVVGAKASMKVSG
jgi:hypothetical protein